MADNLPLAGLNIVVTRPREQAAQLVKGIKELGGSSILFPLLEISPIADNQQLRALIARLNNFHLAIFISPNAVRFGMQAIQEAGNLPSSLQIATVGQGSARALKDLGIQQVIAPQLRFDSEALLDLPEMQNVSGKRVAIFRGDSGRELLGDTLQARGAIVEYATCYRRSKPQHDVASLLAARPDALCVSSSEALRNLWEMLNETGKQLLTALPLFVIHERIAAVARQLGWHNIVIANGGDEGLLSGLATWATHKKGIE